MLITIIIIFTLLLHQQTRHMKIRTETQNNHVHTLFSLAFCRVSSSLSTTVNLLILSSSTGVVFSDDYKSTKKSLDTKIRWVAKKNGSISCLGFPIHSTFLGVSIPISKNKAASKDSFAIFLKPTATTGGGDVTNPVPLTLLLQGEEVVHYVQSQRWSYKLSKLLMHFDCW